MIRVVASILTAGVLTNVVFAALPPPPTPTPIGRACSTPETSKYPFCDTSLSNAARIADLISRLHDEEKPPMLTARESPKGNVSRLGIPEYDWGMNAVHGVQSRCGRKNNGTEWACPTSFPNPIALGASFNMSYVYAMAQQIGIEARSLWLQGVGENHANGYPHIGLDCWSPNINNIRDPRWGRIQEVAGEDFYLVSRYGVAYTKGVQEGQDPRYLQLAVTIKHWCAYDLESWGNATRHNFTAKVTPYELADSYFPSFRSAVLEANAKGFMCAYDSTEVEGLTKSTPACASSFYRDVLRDSWGFEGYVTSDSGAVRDIYENHHYVSSPEEAACVAIRDGQTDINSGSVYSGHLLNATSLGYCSMDDVDLALTRALKIRFELGLFDPIDDQPYWHIPPEVVNTPESQALNLEMTLKSMVLLKNDNDVLPLPRGKTIAVIGPHANASTAMVGNYLGQICPNDEHTFACIVSPFLAIQAHNTGGTTTYTEGCDVACSDDSGFAAAVQAAKTADYVVLGLGIDESIEGESHDRTSITLPGMQSDFAKAIYALNKPTVTFLLNGGQIATPEVKASSPAVLMAFYPGFQGGEAIAQTIFGDSNPGGKLPYTLYPGEYVDQVSMYDMSMTTPPGRSHRFYTGTPIWPFGFGLSYTSFSFAWSGTAPSTSTMKTTDSGNVLTFKVAIKNTGKILGDEVLQAYFKPKSTGIADLKLLQQLFFFQRVSLAAGEETTVVIELGPETLQLADTANGNLVSSPGSYELVFTNGNDQSLTNDLTITGDTQVLVPFPQST